MARCEGQRAEGRHIVACDQVRPARTSSLEYLGGVSSVSTTPESHYRRDSQVPVTSLRQKDLPTIGDPRRRWGREDSLDGSTHNSREEWHQRSVNALRLQLRRVRRARIDGADADDDPPSRGPCLATCRPRRVRLSGLPKDHSEPS